MFWKLCKFEWKCSYRSYLFLYTVLLISSLFLNFKGVMDSASTVVNITAGLVSIIYGICLTTIFIMAFVNVIRNYYQSMFKRNSYLTHTLPVPSWMLVLSKLLAGMFWIILSFFVCFLSVIIIAMNITNINLFDILHAIGRSLSNLPIFDMLKLLLQMLISFAEVVALFYFVMSAANTKYIQRHRAGAAVLIFVVISIIEGFIGGFFMDHITTFPLHMNMYSSYSSNVWFSMATSLLLTCVWFFGNVYLLDHKMEIE